MDKTKEIIYKSGSLDARYNAAGQTYALYAALDDLARIERDYGDAKVADAYAKAAAMVNSVNKTINRLAEEDRIRRDELRSI